MFLGNQIGYGKELFVAIYLYFYIIFLYTRVREHLVSDRASHIFKHLKDSPRCRALCSADNFHVLDRASTGF